MGIFDAAAEIWNEIQNWLQWIVPGIIIFIIFVVLANAKRGWKNFIEDVKEVTSSKWWILWFIIALVAFYIFWGDFKETIGW